MAGALRLLSRKPVRLRYRPRPVAHQGWPQSVAERGGGPDHEAFLALYPPLLRSVYAPSDRVGDERARAIAAGPGRSSSRVRRRRAAVHLGQPLPRARAAPLAVR